MVEEGIYRSGYPNSRNYSFISSLNLKTIVYIASDSYSKEYADFITASNIKLYHIKLDQSKEPFVEIDAEKVRFALDLILDPSNQPVLIHCNKGKHRVGVVAACLRMIRGWTFTSVLTEYLRFNGQKGKVADQEFIETFKYL